MQLRQVLGATAFAACGVCLGVSSFVACSSSSNTPAAQDATVDSSPADAKTDTRDAKADTRDAARDTFEAGPDTNPEFDTTPSDIGPGDASGLFPCGSESCNTLLQYCHVDPGCTVTPPVVDSGSPDVLVDADAAADAKDAGDAGDAADAGDSTIVDAADSAVADTTDSAPADTTPCPRHCELMPTTPTDCTGFPSCSCISTDICGGPLASSCDEHTAGTTGITISCNH